MYGSISIAPINAWGDHRADIAVSAHILIGTAPCAAGLGGRENADAAMRSTDGPGGKDEVPAVALAVVDPLSKATG
jgi:hypothetical protein